ncbi:hypothetical protein ACHWQZ_G004008 [Mnemiopsis leidyi]
MVDMEEDNELGLLLGEMTTTAAEEWFMMIDTDEDGYIGFREMEEYCVGKLAFTKEQVADVFANLDKSDLGKISKQNFMEGLQEFAASNGVTDFSELADSFQNNGYDGVITADYEGPLDPSKLEEIVYEENSTTARKLTSFPSLDYDTWTDMLRRLGALETFEHNDGLREMYYTARDKCPHVLPKLEEFIRSIIAERNNQNQMKASMEDVLNRRQQAYDTHLETLESEMKLDVKSRKYSTQMNQIRLDLSELEKVQELEMIKSKWMESEMKCKKHESRIQELIYGDNDARSTISQLKTENLELQHLIANSQNSLLENKERIQILKNKMQEQAHLLLCETGQKQALQQDNESLRRQFESLAKMKDDLQDEKDSLEQKYQTLLNSSTKSRHMETSTPRSNKKRHRRRGAGGSGSLNQSGYSSSEEEVVGGGPVNGSRTDSALPESDPSFSRENSYDSYEAAESPMKHYSVDGDGVIWKRPSQSSVSHAHPLMASTMRYSPSVTSDDYGQDSGYHIPTSDCSTKPYSVCSVTSLEGRQPERVFKVVLLGDSAVGKSSFIMRLCHNRFQAAFQPTIGVDFQVKTMLIQNTVVSLQLWDTAGQERFRAITKSYLRRVDGVILMYDVTRESSFRNIRDWIQSIEEEDEAPTIMLLGNKADLIATGDQPRAVKTVDGESLAREYNAMFCEVSAKKGTNIHDCCEDLTRSLMKRENQKIAQTNHNIVPDSKDRTKISDKSCSICS